MIVPTTILSLAALSAAESNSSGNRGLRKSSTPWTAIAVVTGTAVTAGVVGGLIGWFTHSAIGGGGHKYPDGVEGYVRGTGCKADYYQTGKKPVPDSAGVTPADERSCAPCASDKTLPAAGWANEPTECTVRECKATNSGLADTDKTCICGADKNVCNQEKSSCDINSSTCSTA